MSASLSLTNHLAISNIYKSANLNIKNLILKWLWNWYLMINYEASMNLISATFYIAISSSISLVTKLFSLNARIKLGSKWLLILGSINIAHYWCLSSNLATYLILIKYMMNYKKSLVKLLDTFIYYCKDNSYKNLNTKYNI